MIAPRSNAVTKTALWLTSNSVRSMGTPGAMVACYSASGTRGLISAQRARYPVSKVWTDCPWVKWRSHSRTNHALAKGGEPGEMDERAQKNSNTELGCVR